ncbi:Anosmin-1 [Liparis tanakae]|uniref:Anosmin-1 n=1 Tax=Liparis tanakae TaxID=230148 RepID=A0A4Z2EQ94_9TELE|nr:Anosmin-1 [Liparis tanakae]
MLRVGAGEDAPGVSDNTAPSRGPGARLLAAMPSPGATRALHKQSFPPELEDGVTLKEPRVTAVLPLQAQSWVELEGLQPNSSFTVELQAVTYWGQVRLKSAKASLRFSTSRNDESVKPVLRSKKEEMSPLGSTLAKRPSGPLEVGTPFYQDGQLQVRVYWKNRGVGALRFVLQDLMSPGTESGARRVKASRNAMSPRRPFPEPHQSGNVETLKAALRENYINLPGLLFSCKYKVTVHMLKSKRRSKDESTTFLTPSCNALRSKTLKHVPCPGEGGEHSACYEQPNDGEHRFTLRGIV